ncbi:MAG: MATE family efflux transporter [Bacteroidetes bacterium]|nr:MATE family efflux transporter [Bacteroidota bacterium]
MFSQESRYYYRKLIRLAVPVSLGQVGHMMTNVADTVMVGKLGTIELAGVTLANNVFVFLFIFGLGLSGGLTPLVGKAFGEKNLDKCRNLMQQGLLFNICAGVLFTLLNLGMVVFMPHMGQEQGVVNVAIPYYYLISLSLLPVLAFSGLKQFLEGMGQTIAPMVISLTGNMFNIFLNWVFIYGKFGLEPMGVNGAGLATLIARCCMFIGLALYLYYNKGLRPFYAGMRRFRPNWPVLTEIGRIGLPVGLQYFMEVAAFALGAIMMGWLGAVPLSAHQIAISLAAITFLAASGIGTASTIMVSNFHGQHRYEELRKTGHSAFRLVLAFMGFTAITFAIFRNWLPSLFVNDPEVLAIASGLLIVAALFQLSDGLQMVTISTLRGLADVQIPMWIAMVAYWVIALPCSYLFAFVLDFGPPGIWYGYLTGLTAAAAAMFWRFEVLTKRLIRQNPA